ncbi:MAG: hypothetical protein HY924_08605 [Elusimicrobia bacterium]|nr:hypothetical protein [Elusimicrobiota bacterium]
MNFGHILLAALMLSPAAARAEEQSQGGPFLSILGGAGPVSGDISAFTRQTATSPEVRDTRPFGTGSSAALRSFAWARHSPLGVAFEGSYLHLPVRGGAVDAAAFSGIILLRPVWNREEPGLFPYAGIGASLYLLRARADFRPGLPVAISTLEGDYTTWTFDARLGLQYQLGPRLALLTEARTTHFSVDRDWTPATWMGPPARDREGIKADATPVLFLAGLAVGLF